MAPAQVSTQPAEQSATQPAVQEKNAQASAPTTEQPAQSGQLGQGFKIKGWMWIIIAVVVIGAGVGIYFLL